MTSSYRSAPDRFRRAAERSLSRVLVCAIPVAPSERSATPRRRGLPRPVAASVDEASNAAMAASSAISDSPMLLARSRSHSASAACPLLSSKVTPCWAISRAASGRRGPAGLGQRECFVRRVDYAGRTRSPRRFDPPRRASPRSRRPGRSLRQIRYSSMRSWRSRTLSRALTNSRRTTAGRLPRGRHE